jgi:hypothetical protein
MSLQEDLRMKSAFAFALSMICAVSFVAAQAPADKPAAQQPAAQQPSTPSTPPSSASASAAGKVTYVGCLKPGTAADSWTLENAEKAATASASASSSTATTAATAGGGSKMTLALTAKPGENLKAHANHKIEVTGTVSPAASSAASPSGAAGAAAGASAAASRQNLSVESVKMVSATCP